MVAGVDPRGFIGRGTELARLEAARARVESGIGATVVIGGEAGIGKSRLVEEFARAFATVGSVLIGSGLPSGGQATPYAPIVEALRGCFRTIEPGRLPAMLGPGRRELVRLLPEIETSAPGATADETDVYGRARLFEAVLAVLERLSRHEPCLLILDDLQWADVNTLDLVPFLIRNTRASPILFVLLVRTDDLDPDAPARRMLAELDRESGVDRLELGPLDRADGRALLEAHGAGSAGDDQLDDLVGRAGGNPFYLEQLAASAGGDGALSPGLRDVIAAQIADLPPRTREVLRAAAAAGRRVDDEILAAVLDAPHAEIADALRVALARRLLVDAGGAGGYTFRHALLREVVYDELLYGERARLHGAFAAQLGLRGQVGGVPVSAAELAYHWDAARDTERAVPAWIEGGLAAERTYAFGDARRAYERALELSSEAAIEVDRIDLVHRAADAAVLAGDYEAAVDLGRHALESAATDPGADPLRIAGLQERMRWYLYEAGDIPAAAEALAEALRLIPEDPPSRARARALSHLAGLRLTTGDADGAAGAARQGLDVARAIDDGAGEAALALGVLGYVTALSGMVEEGLDLFGQGLAIADELGGVEGIALGRTNLAALLDRLGRSEASLEAATAGFERLRELGVARTYGGILAGHAAKALFDLGRWPEAEARADAGLDLDPAGPAAAWLHVVRARLDTNRGCFADAATHLATARGLMNGVSRSRSYRPALLGAEAELAAARGDRAAAWTVAEQAVAAVRAGGIPDPALAWVLWHVIRTEADAAAARSAGVPSDEPPANRDALIELAMGQFDTAPAGDPRAAALGALCRAELARYRGADEAQNWASVAERWGALGRPHLLAYARYREAGALLAARGSRSSAAEALQSARRIADDLGAAPLAREIAILAGHARIDLTEGGVVQPPDGATDPARSLGLTAREAEVIRLLAAGYSNQQIADALFLARKTASVHVSNILGKLGVENRVQAAAIAQRLGLVAENGPGARMTSAEDR